MNTFNLKIFAIVGMTLNHIAILFGEYIPPILRFPMILAGGITFPIMAYLLVEGFRKTSSRFKYAVRLFVFAILAVPPTYLASQPMPLNVLFTLLLGMLAIFLYEKQTNRYLFWLNFVVILLVSLLCDWGFFGIILILAFWVIKDRRIRIFRSVTVLALFMGSMGVLSLGSDTEVALKTIFFAIGVLMSIPLLLAYNGQRGRKLKYFFYVYFPLHWSLLVLLEYLIK